MLPSLIAEFEYELNNSRKLLQAIPEKDIAYQPSPMSWTMGELAQHIATIYHWYEGVFKGTEFDLAADCLERGAPGDLQATLGFFEKNAEKARRALSLATKESLQEDWTMKVGGQTVLGPQPRGVVVRNFLFNHLYHHRGEMIVYLRTTGNKVPGLYGPTNEETLKGPSPKGN